MNLYNKFRNLITIREEEYSPLVDVFLLDVIKNGEFFGFRSGEVLVKLDGTVYALNTYKYPGSDLSYVHKITGFRERDYTSLYTGRPSRNTHIKFWEWVENKEPRVYIHGWEFDTPFLYRDGYLDNIESKLLKEFGYHGA